MGVRFTLPLPPNIANARLHWRAKDRKRVEYLLLCTAMADVPRPTEPLCEARIRATLYVWSLMDTDNLVARMKWPVDWLVDRGYLVDDHPTVLHWDMPQQMIDRKHQRVEIELEGMPQEGGE